MRNKSVRPLKNNYITIYIHKHNILQIKLEYKINNRLHAKYMYSNVYHINSVCKCHGMPKRYKYMSMNIKLLYVIVTIVHNLLVRVLVRR